MNSGPSVAARVPAPTRVEVAALTETVRYLRRVGAQTATLLLLAPDRAGEGAVLELLRDELLACADLCESLLELTAERNVRR